MTKLKSGGIMQWTTNLGPVTNQDFWSTELNFGLHYPEIFIGTGDYSPYYKGKTNDSVVLNQTNTDNMQIFDVSSVGFGQMNYNIYNGTPSSAYYVEPSTKPATAIFSYNFVGLGLPMNQWYALTSLLDKVNTTVTKALTCSHLEGGNCTLNLPCDTFQNNLWKFSFKL